LRQAIDSAKDVMALWGELFFAFEEAYRTEPRDESLIARIYSFADWCLEAPRGGDAGHDPFTAVIAAFYEDIPTIPQAREDMPRWFTYAEVAESKEVFGYMLDPKEYDKLVRFMERNQHLYRPRERQSGKEESSQ
jgi:hypothetical protein